MPKISHKLPNSVNLQQCNCITVTSHEYHGVWSHWQLHCLLNSLFRLITRKTLSYTSLALWPGDNKGQGMWQIFLHHDVISFLALSDSWGCQAINKHHIITKAELGLLWFITLMVCLTHLPLDKMATILADNIFKSIFLNENNWIPTQISLKFVSKSLVDNKPALVQVMTWHQTTVTWTNDDGVHWSIYAAPGGDELAIEVRTKWLRFCRLYFQILFLNKKLL